MYPTTIGLVLLPLTAIFAGRPIRLLQLALIFAIFEAAAALVIGGFGIQPALVPGLVFLVYVVLQYAAGMRYPGEGRVFSTLAPLLLLLSYALLSIAVLPDIFAGKVFVAPQKVDPLGGAVLVPLEYTSGNMTQTLYLTQNVVVTLFAALFLTRFEVPYHKIIAAYLLGGYIEVVIALWQFASRTAGVPFPDDVLYSNPGWAIVAQAIGTVPRIQGSFSEPAGLAVYLLGLSFCCAWLVAHGQRTMRPDLLLGLAILVILLSTSTTGLVCLFIGLPLLLTLAALRGDRYVRTRLQRLVVLLAVGGSLAIGPIFVLKPDLLKQVDEVVQGTLSKQEGDSYNDRTALDEAALATVGQTYGLGVGWGSFRPSSLIPGLLANGGVFGVAMLIWLGGRVARLATRAAAKTRDHPGGILVSGFSAALCGQLAAAVISAPTITSTAFFLQLGCVVGAAARMEFDSVVARRCSSWARAWTYQRGPS
ncbi:MAG TPA: hypothetical protein VJ779_04635 [Acetobacteraceae bacterium]|nr:hypothetical protein [Acetobacteraceae bacterium]